MFAVVLTREARAQCPNPPVVVTNAQQPPADVCIPSGFGGLPIQFFDDFSWRTFIALVWPAKAGQRGVPDTSKTVGAPGARVFETYKALAEIFRNNDSDTPRADWNAFDPPNLNACNVQTGFDDMVLASFSKFSNLGQAGFGNLVGPLIAQNRTYVRFLTGFNRLEFEAIQAGKWFLKANIPAAGVTFPNGSIDVKSAWIDMKDKSPARFYTRTAWVMDPETSTCSQKQVGLAGLHIVIKTPSRPQWIWSSFEQVDNVQEPGAQAPFNFNDGTGAPMPTRNPYPVNPLPLPTPAAFNVTRVQPIHNSTQQTNGSYQAALAGTPWQFYRLVVTQWPVCANPPCAPSMRGTPANTFPGTGATTAWANLTMETFDQGSIATGCMSCHNVVQTVAGVTKGTDFVWSLRDHAFQPNVPNINLDRDLKMLLERAIVPAEAGQSAAKRNKQANERK
jgi:hypothetical protein